MVHKENEFIIKSVRWMQRCSSEITSAGGSAVSLLDMFSPQLIVHLVRNDLYLKHDSSRVSSSSTGSTSRNIAHNTVGAVGADYKEAPDDIRRTSAVGGVGPMTTL